MSTIKLQIHIAYGLPGQPMHYLTLPGGSLPFAPWLGAYDSVDAERDGNRFQKPVAQILKDIEQFGFSQVAPPTIYV